MAQGADVQSIPALRDWLAALSGYRDDAADALSGTQQEIRRGLDWLYEQLTLWHRAGREAEEAVVQAKAELAARKFPGWDGRMPDTTVQEKNLRRAQAWQEHCEEQVRKCKSWLARLPKLVDETYTGRGHKLQNFLEGDLARGAAALGRRLDSLEQYAEIRPDYSTAPSTYPGPSAPPPAPPKEGPA